MKTSLRALIACLTVLAPLAVPAESQEITGTIFGALRDQTGGVLAGVKVVITSTDTGRTREVVTNSTGQYAASLPVGNYEISFVLPKFQPFTAGGISLHVNDRLQVNGRLMVGAVETLTVTAERLVQPTAAVGALIAQTAVRELPLLTRTIVQLVTLVPGVSSDLREEACFCDQATLDVSINGARRSAVSWLLDGASNVNGWNNYTLVTSPSLEAIREINVITSTYSAEWARNGGGVVNAVTKSGTSRFSGSAYHFLRNDALNANSFFRNKDPSPAINSTPPRLRYNNFGYTSGGPVLPSRRKAFAFVSQEWRRRSENKWLAQAFVPDPVWLTDSASPEYVAPEARDANAVKLLALWPSPNVPGTNEYQTTITSELDTRQEFVRGDYSPTAQWSVTGRYLHDRADSRGEYATTPDLAPGHRYRVGDLLTVEGRRAGRRVVHESSYQFSRYRLARDDRTPSRSELGIRIPELFPENAAKLVPMLEISGLNHIGVRSPGAREYSNHTVSSSASLQHDTHTVRTGGLFSIERLNSNLVPEITHGVFMFAPAGGFTAFQNFLRGNADGACGSCIYAETDIDVTNRFRTGRYELYVQDTWRAHSRLTLELGLRYAFYRPLTDADDRLFTFSPDAYDRARAPGFADANGRFVALASGSLFNGIRVAGVDSAHGRAIHAADTNNLQPRVGAAWDPSGAGRMYVRAGYGVYFDQTQAELFAESTQFSSFDPFRTDLLVRNPPLSNPGGGPVPPEVWPKSSELLFPQSIRPGTVLTPRVLGTSDPFVAPRWQHWNVGLQRRLYARGRMDIGYVGSRGDHLIRYVDINRPDPATVLEAGGASKANLARPFPGYESIIIRETAGRSRYHGLLASFRHEGGRAGLASVNYTASRNNADATYDNSFVDTPQNPRDADDEFGAAGTDRMHIFSASYVYELPFGRGGAKRWWTTVLAGWQVSGITRIESGSAARLRVPIFPGALRPDQTGDPGAGDQPGLLWFNPAAFAAPRAGEYGTAPVAPFRLPGRHQWDIALARQFGLGGARRLQFRAELINAFNHTQFLDVNTTCTARPGTTACDTASGFGQVTSTRPPREVQLGVRVDW